MSGWGGLVIKPKYYSQVKISVTPYINSMLFVKLPIQKFASQNKVYHHVPSSLFDPNKRE